MKKLNIFYLLLTLTLVLGSCGSSNVVNNSLISKRKYNKGFHINSRGHFKKDKEVAKVEEVEEAEIKINSEKSTKERTTIQAKQTQTVTSTEELTLAETVSNDVVVTDQSDSKTSTTDSKTAKEEIISETEDKGENNTRKAFKNKAKESNNNGGSSSDIIFILAVIFAILLPPLGVGIYTNIDWMKVLIAFLLSLLFWLPGIIYALLVVFDVI